MARSFVELLNEEAPPEAFEEQLRLARDEDASEAELERLRAEIEVSLRVRTKMTQQRQREAELRALYETATDLAAIRDVDSVLRAIVRRARDLLGVDLAYLSLIDDERRDVYIRVTDGSVSARFRAIRLPLGAGLGGLVVHTTTPYATGDYQSDDRFLHTTDVDAAVSDEGIHALLGVPLLLAGRVIGALLAGNRSPRPFPPEEVALATRLAAHAVVALENARLFSETQAALHELDHVTALVRRHAHEVELAADAHDRLTGVLLHGGGAVDVAKVLAEVLGGGVAVLDPNGAVLAAVGGETPPVDESLLAAVHEARRTGGTVELDLPIDRCWLAAAVAGTNHLGTLVLSGPDRLAQSAQRIFERAAVVTALLLLFQRSVAEAEHRVRGELLEDVLLRPERDSATLRERARHHRANLDLEHAVVVAAMDYSDRERAVAVAARLAAEHRGLAGHRDGRFVVILPGRAPAEAAQFVSARLREALGCVVTAGADGPAAGPAAIRDAYHEARRCLSALLALGRHGESCDVGGLGFAGMILGSPGPDDVDGFVRARLGPLLDHDARRGSDLVGTLEAYFASGGNLKAARSVLQVHTNTVALRLERIATLLGVGWKQPQQALELQLALHLRRLRQSMTEPTTSHPS
ncbi:helix-turn-helix domain-containing protein [Micromonospora coerulea]|uniref:helix-turn-helix domain-containing protein n=1 Tax=Micromonospora coerulea TaxID=47856 RepID=UPI0019045FCD|nr:GAF domain-containing protein [Micromonospora veneta]